MSCRKCGQVPIHLGGPGCICGKCKQCLELSAGTSGYCFFCDPRDENKPLGRLKLVPGSWLDKALKRINKDDHS